MGKLTTSNKSKLKGEMWLTSNIDANQHKVKHLRLVCRGARVSCPPIPIQTQSLCESDSKMNVDTDVGRPTQAHFSEEAKNGASMQVRTTPNICNNNQPIGMRVVIPKQDHSEAMNYLTLIQEVQRKRKFAEISNELRQQNNQPQFGSSVSRRDRLLSHIYTKHEFPGKSGSNNFKSGEDGSELESQVMPKNSHPFDGMDSTVTSKRPKLAEMDSNSEGQLLVNLSA